MKRKKIKIALIFGGRSAEHEVSLTSACSIYNNLDKEKYEIFCFYINRQGLWKRVESPLQSFLTLNKGQFSSFLPWEKKAPGKSLEADIYFPVL
ncbi:MAG: D-alanine--D-alanine ligase A, partial [Candidatus Aminicenantales bacterium]